MGKVVVDMGYVVDLDDEYMVEHAKSSLFEDVMNAVKFNEIHLNIKELVVPEALHSEIPQFLLPEENEVG